MKIYKFEFSAKKLKKTVLDADEKPKTYVIYGTWKYRINKSDVGVVTGFYKDTVYLPEDNEKLAVSLLIEDRKNLLEIETKSYEKQKSRIENDIQILEEL